MKPVARKSGLVVRELADEVVVYDQERHEAHCLNHTAALVFRHADGRRSISDLSTLMDAESVPEGEALVQMALGQLADAHLLESVPPGGPENGVSRREVMRRVGIGAAVLLPLVSSVLAPTPAEAAATCVQGVGACSGQTAGTPCCCPGTCPTCLGVCDGAGSCSDGC